jgi:hypothetical protein
MPPSEPAVREDVRHHGEPEKRVEVGRVGDEQHALRDLADDVEHALDDTAAAQLHEGLGIAAHARTLAARLNDAGNHWISTCRSAC